MLVRVEEADRQILHTVEHLAAHLVKEALRDDRHVGQGPHARRDDGRLFNELQYFEKITKFNILLNFVCFFLEKHI